MIKLKPLTFWNVNPYLCWIIMHGVRQLTGFPNNCHHITSHGDERSSYLICWQPKQDAYNTAARRTVQRR